MIKIFHNELDVVTGGQLIQRCVIIQQDEKGYGLTVSGDNPVFVQSVKESKSTFSLIPRQIDVHFALTSSDMF